MIKIGPVAPEITRVTTAGFWTRRQKLAYPIEYFGNKSTDLHQLFTARGYAKRGICRRRMSVCVCVCLSVTLRYCIKTAKRRITQTTPHDSPMILVF